VTSSDHSRTGANAPGRASTVLGATLILAAIAGLTLTAPEQHPPAKGVDGGTAIAANGQLGGEGHFEPIRCEARGPTLRRNLKTKRKVVALTFDDGPSDSTGAFIHTLERFKAHATFYVVGREVPGREQMLRRAVKADNSVGNHTYDHADIAAGGAPAEGQIRSTTKLIRDATGVRPCTFRPPYGSRSQALDKLVKREEMVEILWNVDTEDYNGVPAEEIRSNAISGLDRGSIILMHDGGGDERNTLAALPGILREIKKRGFEAVTVPELLKLELGRRR
jgi:peptidoglycan/xylan/chitin deacetylase (PgdA/CDA1 family)